MNDSRHKEEEALKGQVYEALKSVGCCDYRFGVAQLGLVHDVQVDEERRVRVKVLPCCIFGMTRLVTSVQEGLAEIEGINRVDVDVAWDQMDQRSRVSQASGAVLQLNLEALAQEHGLKGWGSTARG